MPSSRSKRIVPYTADEVVALVDAVERYPEFLPWCVGARIRKREGTEIVADLIIGFRLFRERFTSKVSLLPDNPGAPRIDTVYADGPFKRLENHWIFHPHPDGCDVEFFVDFEFKSYLLQATVEILFHEAVRRMVAAFEGRAAKLYGAVPRGRLA